jgi:endoglucanase
VYRRRASKRRSGRLLAVLASFALAASCAACDGGSGPRPGPVRTPSAEAALPGPLHTDGRWIVDASGHRVKLAGVNWSGAETPAYVVGGLDVRRLDDLAALIAAGGFDSVRLPWSDQLVEENPVVPDRYLAANPQLQGEHALDVLDAVIAALGRHGVMVVLDDHRSRADWCCDEVHGDGLWYTRAYPEAAWIADWRTMAARYRRNPDVVGAELRNEIRPEPQLAPGPTTATWGDGSPSTDWRAAAQRAGNAVLAEDPGLLVIVGGVDFGANLTGAYLHPVRLAVPHRLVYAAHDYSAMHTSAQLSDYRLFGLQLGIRFGMLTVAGQPFTAPVYLSETGTCTQPTDADPCRPTDPAYLRQISRYLEATDLDFAYWPLNGTQGPGYDRVEGAVETYGLLAPDWSRYGNRDVLSVLQQLQRPTRGPGVGR